MSETVHQVQRPLWFTDFQTIAKPTWASCQLFSKTLPSTRTRLAFLSSRMFFTCHTSFHDVGRVKWLRRISMSDGVTLEILGSAPPNRTISPAPSRWLLTIL